MRVGRAERDLTSEQSFRTASPCLRICAMNVDLILTTFNQHSARFLMIGGMNFMLRHQPILTYDLDLWIEDTNENRQHCESALADLGAEWGATEEAWGPVASLSPDWLARQEMYCLTSKFGAIDIFRVVKGLDNWQVCWKDGLDCSTSAGVTYRALSDEDMLRCQLALDSGLQKQERIRILREAIQRKSQHP